MDTIFKREDFDLCSVPVPNGYPQSQTHCSIGETKDSYYLVTSPFPVRSNSFIIYTRAIIRELTFGLLCNDKRGESYENPCLYKASKSGRDHITCFTPMSTKALMDTPDPCYGYPSFNSDPELLLDGSIIYVLNRSTYRKNNGYVNRLYLIEGVDESGWFKTHRVKLVKEEVRSLISPCIRRYKDKYVFTYLDTNSYNDGESFKGLYVTFMDTLDDITYVDKWRKVEVEGGDYLPWHMSLFTYKGKLYTIVACIRKGEPRRCWQMLGVFSDDLSCLKIYQTPLTDYKSYRSAALVNEEGMFVLYNTTVNEKIKGGKSVDGREIMTASMAFNNMMMTLSNSEKC